MVYKEDKASKDNKDKSSDDAASEENIADNKERDKKVEASEESAESNEASKESSKDKHCQHQLLLFMQTRTIILSREKSCQESTNSHKTAVNCHLAVVCQKPVV